MSFTSDPPLQSNQLSTNVEFDNEKPEFNDILNLSYRRVVDAVNTKEGALYLLKELANFKTIFGVNEITRIPDPQLTRNSYRITINMISPPTTIVPGANATVAHGIDTLKDSVLVYCSCKNATGQLFTLVYPDVYIDGTNAVVTNPATAPSAITQAMFVAEYTKN